MEIRPLTKADASAFHALRLSALRECPEAFGSSFEEESDIPIAVVSDRIAATANHCLFGAFDQADLVGCIGLRRETKRKLAHKALVWGMYVAPSYHSKGIGRQLLAEALQLAESMAGLRQVKLSVTAANAAAITLYESMGFRSFGVELNSLLLDGVFHNEIHMVRYAKGDT